MLLPMFSEIRAHASVSHLRVKTEGRACTNVQILHKQNVISTQAFSHLLVTMEGCVYKYSMWPTQWLLQLTTIQ